VPKKKYLLCPYKKSLNITQSSPNKQRGQNENHWLHLINRRNCRLSLYNGSSNPALHPISKRHLFNNHNNNKRGFDISRTFHNCQRRQIPRQAGGRSPDLPRQKRRRIQKALNTSQVNFNTKNLRKIPAKSSQMRFN